MLEKQRTIKTETRISGIGLHTGCNSNMIFKPAPEDHGIIFRRTDLENLVDIPATIDYVDSISRGTILSNNGVKIHTVEHVLAAISGLNIDNILVELDAEEPPVMDGSSIDFVNLLKDNIIEQEKPRQYFEIKEIISFKDEEKGIELIGIPAEKFQVTYMVDYQNPALGTQFSSLYDLEEEFIKDYAPTRTFCFLTEVEQLKDAGLIKGGSLDNSVVILDRELSPEERKKVELWAEGMKQLASPDNNDSNLNFVFEVVRKNETVPVILTDADENVLYARNIDSLKLDDENYLKTQIKIMKEQNPPIEINIEEGIVQRIYYRDSILGQNIHLCPYPSKPALLYSFKCLPGYRAFVVAPLSAKSNDPGSVL